MDSTTEENGPYEHGKMKDCGVIRSYLVENIPPQFEFPDLLPYEKVKKKKSLMTAIVQSVLEEDNESVLPELCRGAFTDMFEIDEIPKEFFDNRPNVIFDRLSKDPIFKDEEVWKDIFMSTSIIRPDEGYPNAAISYRFPEDIDQRIESGGLYDREVRSVDDLVSMIRDLKSLMSYKFPDPEYLLPVLEATEVCFNNFHLYRMTEDPSLILARYGLTEDLPNSGAVEDVSLEPLWETENSGYINELLRNSHYSHWFARRPTDYDYTGFMEIYYKPGRVLLYSTIRMLEQHGLIAYDTKESQSIIFIRKR